MHILELNEMYKGLSEYLEDGDVAARLAATIKAGERHTRKIRELYGQWQFGESLPGVAYEGLEDVSDTMFGRLERNLKEINHRCETIVTEYGFIKIWIYDCGDYENKWEYLI